MGDNRDNSKLSFKDLTRKLVVPIVAIQANCVLIEDNKCVFFPTIPFKHTKPGKRPY